MAAEDIVAYIQSWPDLDEAFVKYQHCDDGSIAAGFSEAASNLLAYKWEGLAYIRSRPSLFKFVLSHVDETWDLEYYEVLKNLEQSCPNLAKSISEAVINLPAK